MRLIDGFGAAGKREAKVLTLGHQRYTEADFPGCRDLLTYWDALRGSRLVPMRTDFDPRGIERTLASTFVAERVAPSVVRIRVAGSQLSALLGMDVRGMPITAFFEPDARSGIADACRRALTGPEKVVLDLTSPGGLGRPTLHARLILLPMSDVHGDITRVVGCLETIGREGRLPRRFTITRTQTSTLSGDAPLAAPRLPALNYTAAKAPERALEMADTPMPAFQSKRHETRGMKAAPITTGLRLVVDNT